MRFEMNAEIVHRGEHFITVIKGALEMFGLVVAFLVAIQLSLGDKPPLTAGVVTVEGL